MKSKVSSCQLKGKHIKDTCYHDDKSKVEDKLEELNTGNNNRMRYVCVCVCYW